MDIFEKACQKVRTACWRLGHAVFKARVRRAARKADRLAAATGQRFYVFRLGGRVRVVPKRTVKDLIRRRRFKRGVTVRDIERHCLYITKNGGSDVRQR